MKKYLLISLFFSSGVSFSQTNIFPSIGSAGVGTTSPSTVLMPGNNLSINANDGYSSLVLQNGGTDRGFFTATASQAILGTVTANTTLQFNTNGLGRMLIDPNGKVGIGTTSPLTDLHVNGTSTTSLLAFSEGTTSLGYLGRGLATTGAWNQSPNALALTYQSRDFIIGGWSKSDNSWMGASFYINSDNGNIGIGTTDPRGYKLAVNGKIRAQEIKVEATNWPDYVFVKDYTLPSLKATEKHIKEKGHLPGIPSAEEVKTNGIDLGEMNAKLLQKIEELTLHLIKLNDTVINQQKQINRLEKKGKQ